MSDTEDDGYALIDAYEAWDDYEGEYDCYLCHECGEYLTDSLRIALHGDAVPRTCPNCGRELRW